MIRSSTLFDREWYLWQYPDVRHAGVDEVLHYLEHGAMEGRDPGPFFDTDWYLDCYADVGKSRLNPLVHYLKHGAAEGRDPRRPLATRFRSRGLGKELASRRWRRPDSPEPGVNFIGPVEFLSGLGTSARGYMRCLARAGIRLNVIPWRAGFERLRSTVVDYPSAELQPINLVHLNFDLLSSERLLESLPLADIVTPDRYNIVIPYWELASVPVEWTGVIQRFDEVWCASSFMARSIAAVSTRPVRIVRPALECLPTQRSKTRSDFGLPKNRFVFFYATDAGSILGRKNPGALIDAYIAEFAPIDGACCLVKIHYSDPNNSDIRGILSIIQNRPDLIIMDRLLDATAMSNLYDLIDCYVSPHRSEGLGLTILEAMSAKKPVIATAYGGVTDFVTRETAYPISYRPIKVGKGHLPYPEQFLWADPLQSSLRSTMRFVLQNSDTAMRVGLRGHAHIRSMFSLDRTAAKLRVEIHRIWNCEGAKNEAPSK